MVKYLYQDETYAIRGCLNAVAFELGSGFLEKVYQEALELEFKEAGIPYEREVKLSISYKGKRFNKSMSQISFAMVRLSLNLRLFLN